MSFEALYKAFWPKIFRLCRSYVNDPDLAQDLAQETFIKVWQQLPRFRHEAAIGTWIFRIAVNQCLRQLEKEQRFPRTEMPLNLPEEPATALEPQLQFLYHCIG
ncbi:MAG: RNA polymerase sigma factor, partial [Pedobacter sp.]